MRERGIGSRKGDTGRERHACSSSDSRLNSYGQMEKSLSHRMNRDSGNILLQRDQVHIDVTCMQYHSFPSPVVLSASLFLAHICNVFLIIINVNNFTPYTLEGTDVTGFDVVIFRLVSRHYSTS